MEGNYRVIVKFANQELAKSPYNVYVEGQVGDANKVHAHGPGIEPQGVVVDQPTFFEVDASRKSKIIFLPKISKLVARLYNYQLILLTYQFY